MEAAGFYLSWKHPPVVFTNDTPCGFVQHVECRDMETAENLWVKNAGCFEKPTLGKNPKEVSIFYFYLCQFFRLTFHLFNQ